ncbi:MAG TPA: type II toxin-antitoxin system HicB family antitoxin [Bacteroidota bacterium]|nr:type II toxin-antitoxin system HicB family antitoxin [Bacteroidota bacterium]
MTQTFTLEYWKEKTWYVGRLKEVPGVFSQAKTLSELEQNIKEVYKLMQEEEASLPLHPVKTKVLAIAV